MLSWPGLSHQTMPMNDDDFGRTIAIKGSLFPEATPAAEAIGHYLVMLEGIDPGKRLEITADPITIGRQAPQTFVVNDPELSRRHARISLVDGRTVLEDVGSTNGTYVDGKRLTGPVTLKDNCAVRV